MISHRCHFRKPTLAAATMLALGLGACATDPVQARFLARASRAELRDQVLRDVAAMVDGMRRAQLGELSGLACEEVISPSCARR